MSEMGKNDRHSSILWALLGLYLSFEGYCLKLGTPENPGSGFFIFWGGILLAGLSFLLFIQTFYSKRKEEKGALKGRLQYSKPIKLMVALCLYALVFKWMGFFLATFCLLLFLFKGWDHQRWRKVFVLSLVSVSLFYVLFVVLLEIRFPGGILERLVIQMRK